MKTELLYDTEVLKIEEPNTATGYKSSNPVVSDDGRYMAFQVARKGDWAGVGRGILIFDLNAVNK